MWRIGERRLDTLVRVGKRFMGPHRPAWTPTGVEELAFGHFEITVVAAIE
jgi:hypothetical protein